MALRVRHSDGRSAARARLPGEVKGLRLRVFSLQNVRPVRERGHIDALIKRKLSDEARVLLQHALDGDAARALRIWLLSRGHCALRRGLAMGRP